MKIIASEGESMPRYIDANFIKTGLKQEFCAACSSDYENNRQCCAACDIAYTMNLIDETPTADVEPVRHGRWITTVQKDATTVGQHSVTKCSECGYVIFTATNNYCAKCGAKMDKEVEE